MATWTQMVHLSLLVCLGSKLFTMATQCDDVCVYNRDRYIRDANCHGKELARIPSGCEDATTLHLGDNNVVIDEETFTNFNQLEILYFRQNEIDSLVAGVFQPIATTIQCLDLSSNVISQLENNTFVNMTQLEQLNLSKNRIFIIAKKAFQNLPNLELLLLLDNLIEHLPPSVFDEMPHLQQLYLQNNNLLKLNSRTLLNLNSLVHLSLSKNNITALIGEPLRADMQLQNINLSLNRIEQFDCPWTNALSSLTSIDLSQNSIQSISNCQSNLSILKLTDNPFDCGCTRTIVASWFHANPNLTSPICRTPPGKQGQKLRDVLFDECFTSASPTVSTTSGLQSTQIIHQKTLTGRSEYIHVTKEKMTVNSRSGVAKDEYASTRDKLFQDENILYIIIFGFVILTVIVVILIITVLVRHFLHSRKQKNSSHYTTTIANPSLSNTHYRQSLASSGTRNSASHLYATIPGDRRNTGDFTISTEPAREIMSSSHRKLDTRRQSDIIHRSPSHRSSNTRQEFAISINLSDSQDSGLADQGLNRDSVTEWLMLHGGLHYLQIPHETSDEMSPSEQPDETAPLTVHPIPPPRLPHGDDHRIKPEMVTFLNSPCQPLDSCHKSHPSNFRENPELSQAKTFRLAPSKERPSSGTYIPHHTVS